nr:immunoglobulin heavy chain junction region [Mus musculus]
CAICPGSSYLYYYAMDYW